MTAPSTSRLLLFVLATWLLILAGAEFLAQVSVRVLPASSPLRRLLYPSRFSLHRMARLAGDTRVATLIPGYRSVLVDADYPANEPWPVTIDKNGFRGDPAHYERKRRVIVFIGDSVPFGWGVADDASVPSRLHALLRDHGIEDVGVLNGAVPAYSLSQAVERFKREIAGRYPVASVIVQTLDPAMTLSLLGERWNPSISFHTRHREPTAPLLGAMEDYLDKSLLFSAALRVAYRLRDRTVPIASSAITASALAKFDHANTTTLSELVDLARTQTASVVLLPINPGAVPETAYSDRERSTIDHFNRFLEGFASDQPDVYYWNVKEEFEASPARDTLFVDTCCHLSEAGARLQAEYLFDRYEDTGLLTSPGAR